MTEKPSLKKEMTSEEIQQLLERDKAARMEKCRSEIEVVLQKHKCQLIALPGIDNAGRVIAAVQIQIL